MVADILKGNIKPISPIANEWMDIKKTILSDGFSSKYGGTILRFIQSLLQ